MLHIHLAVCRTVLLSNRAMPMGMVAAGRADAGADKAHRATLR
jgi:hypothetical protein